MKKTLVTLLMIVLAIVAFASTQDKFLIKIDRGIFFSHYQITELSQLSHKLPYPLEIYYTSEQYLLAGVSKEALRKISGDSYELLDSFPLADNWYLVSKLPDRSLILPEKLGQTITRMDNVLLVKSRLFSEEIALQCALPCTRMDFLPLPLDRLTSLTPPQSNRIDFGSLLTQVNADSITWFIQKMQDMGTRYAGATNAQNVANWIRSQFLRFGITNCYLDPFFVASLTGNQWNVEATIPGTLCPERVIIIGGHHDSITNDGSDIMVLAPGADDNASGTTAALEIARVMMANNYQPECTIKFVTFGCEELGLWGSKHYAAAAQENGYNIKLMINHDMISNCTVPPANWIVLLQPYDGWESHTSLAMDIVNDHTNLLPAAGALNSAGSDSHSFWQRGFPCIYFEESQFCPFYHSANDIVANINPQYCKEVIKASLAVALTYDQMPAQVDSIYVHDTGTGNSLQVNWISYSPESDVSGYKVYIGASPGNLSLVSLTTSSPFTIPNLQNGARYFVGVSAVDTDNNEGMIRTFSATPQILPSIPQNFSDQPVLNAVNLNWSPNTELDLAGYKIYRSTSETGTYTLLNPALITTTSFSDDSVADLIYYYYKLIAVDSNGNQSTPSAIIRSRALTFNQGILIVDETRNNTSNTVFAPNDATCDTYYSNLTEGFQTAQFDTQTDGLLRLADIGIYSSILWHGNDMGELTYPLAVRDELRKYLLAGGKILISSYLPSLAFDNNNSYPYTYHSGDFMYDTFGVKDVDFDNSTRFRYAYPENSGFPALTVDSLKTLTALNGHIYKIESIGARPEATEIYFYGSDYANDTSQGELNGQPVGVYYQTGAGKSVILSFPLFNMKADQAQDLVQYVFNTLFAETGTDDDSNVNPLVDSAILSTYPNPFNRSISLNVAIKNTAAPISAVIYNVKGQKVKTLFTGITKSPEIQLEWNGLDEHYNTAANGLYFVRIEQNGKAVSGKFIKLK